jgi:hypothetical protein
MLPVDASPFKINFHTFTTEKHLTLLSFSNSEQFFLLGTVESTQFPHLVIHILNTIEANRRGSKI